MKVCIPLRDDIPHGNLRADNLRSEGRWERLALEACTQNNAITEIYTSGYEWHKSFSPKYRGKINSSSSTDCILLAQDWNGNIFNSHQWKAAVINIFMGPWIHEIADVQAAFSKLNGNLFFTMGFPILYKQELGNAPVAGEWPRTQACHLEQFLPRENILCLPVPAIPENRWENRFNRTTLLYAWRAVGLEFYVAQKTIHWALNKLIENSALRLHILTGWSSNEVKKIENGNAVFLTEEINAEFWKFKEIQSFLSVKNRVQVFYAMDWDKAVEQYAQSKLLCVYNKLYGGPPLEASMFGVPFVGTAPIGAMAECPGYLYRDTQEEAVDILNKLYTEEDYYLEKSKAYNKYAIETYSFEAFNNNLNNILKERNLL